MTDRDDVLALLPLAEPAESEGRPRVRCALCGRPLRDRVARRWGLGPECRAKLGERTAPRPPQAEVEQEMLPGV